MVKVSKAVVIIPAQYQSVRLEASEANDFAECNRVLTKELSKYKDLIPKDQMQRLQKILRN